MSLVAAVISLPIVDPASSGHWVHSSLHLPHWHPGANQKTERQGKKERVHKLAACRLGLTECMNSLALPHSPLTRILHWLSLSHFLSLRLLYSRLLYGSSREGHSAGTGCPLLSEQPYSSPAFSLFLWLLVGCFLVTALCSSGGCRFIFSFSLSLSRCRLSRWLPLLLSVVPES